MTSVASISPPGETPSGRVRLAIGAERLPALARLLGRDRAQAARFELFAAQERLSIERLWGSFAEDGRVEAAALVTPYPGRTAMLTVSTLRGAAEEAAGTETVRAAVEDATALDVTIVQALLDPRHAAEISVLRRAGFRPLAMLTSMERPVSRSLRMPAAPLPAGVTLEGYDDSPPARQSLARLLEATYIDTLDCPGLAGLRRASDILEGHRRGGRFDPTLWTVLRLDGADVGALLLNEAPHLQTLELVYLGLAPAARGRGLGRILIERAVSTAAHRGVRSVMLAVDEENAPALRLYRAAGFRRHARRAALVRPVEPR